MKLYLDCCCFNRPFDEERNDRIGLEAEAILRILSRVEAGEFELIVSDAVLFELRRMPDIRRKESCLAMARLASVHVVSNATITDEALQLSILGFKPLDAAHLAFAKLGKADVFLTVDDRLLRKAKTLRDIRLPSVANPADWLMLMGQGDPE